MRGFPYLSFSRLLKAKSTYRIVHAFNVFRTMDMCVCVCGFDYIASLHASGFRIKSLRYNRIVNYYQIAEQQNTKKHTQRQIKWRTTRKKKTRKNKQLLMLNSTNVGTKERQEKK